MKFLNIKRISLTLITLLLLFSVVGCSNKPTEKADEKKPEATTIVDREGNTIEIPKKTDKIVSISPSITQTLIHLGLADKIVAIDQYSAGLEGLPEGLPTYDILAPDVESLAALEPDILFATGMTQAESDDPFKPVRDLGIIITYIPSATSISAIKEDINFLGKMTDTSDQAKAIVDEMEKEIDAILETYITPIDQETAPTVYFEIAEAPHMYSFGTGTFLNEMIELLDAKNILADQESWVSVTEEAVIAKNPDIIFTNVGYLESPVEDVLNRKGWDVITAVQDKSVYFIDQQSSSQPNEYIVEALLQMAQAISPVEIDEEN